MSRPAQGMIPDDLTSLVQAGRHLGETLHI